MPLTRASLESTVVHAFRPWLEAVGLDVMTVDGTNADLNGAIYDALASSGYAVADAANVTDEDLAAIPASREYRMRLLISLQVLRLVRNWFTAVGYTAGNRSQSLSQLWPRLEGMIQELEAEITVQGGLPVLYPQASTGQMLGGFDRGAGGLAWPRPGTLTLYDRYGYPEELP
jgi:hypothetical protein